MMVVCTPSRVTLAPHTGASSSPPPPEKEDLQSQSRALLALTRPLALSGLARMITTSMLSTFM